MRRVSSEQLERATPRYVERARKISHYIFERALSDSSSKIQLDADVFNAEAPNYSQRVLGHEQLVELWASGKRIESVRADAPLDSARLAIENSYAGDTYAHTQVWVYTPRRKFNLSEIDPRNQGRDRSPEDDGIDWIRSADRAHLGNLVMPGYSFSPSSGFESDPPRIFTYLYTAYDAKRGKHKFSSASGLGNILLNTYQTALAPRYSAEDKKLMEQYGYATYHTQKIERILGVMASIAGRDIE